MTLEIESWAVFTFQYHFVIHEKVDITSREVYVYIMLLLSK